MKFSFLVIQFATNRSVRKRVAEHATGLFVCLYCPYFGKLTLAETEIKKVMTLNLDQTKHFANKCKKEKAENPEENNKEQKSEKLELGSGTQFVCESVCVCL